MRLDEAHDGVGRDGRVRRMPAALEHLHAGARRERLARRDDAVFGGDLGTARDNVHDSRKYYREES